jgi:hypothetical protein
MNQPQGYYTENQQQQQFDQNVQSIFGIGQSNQMDEYYDPNARVNDPYYDPYTSPQAQDVNTSAFLTALCFNAVLFVVLMTSYEFFKLLLQTMFSRGV